MIRWISSLFFSEIGSLGRGMDLEKEVSSVLLQFGFLRVFPVHVQEAGRYVGLKLEGEQRALGNIYTCTLGRRNTANKQNPVEAVEEDQE